MTRFWRKREIKELVKSYGVEDTQTISLRLDRSIPAIHQKAKKLGLDAPYGVRITPPHERFWDKVEKRDSCWNWAGAKGENGYGVISTGSAKQGRLV